MGNPHYKEAKAALRLKVRRLPFGQTDAPEEWRELPVSGMTLHFNMHSMPEASFLVPPGRNPSRFADSTITDLKDELTTEWEIVAEVTMTGWVGPRVLVRDKTFTVWRGIVVGVGYTASAGTFQYTVNSAHWLHYLDAASCTSGGIVKNSPYNLRSKFSVVTDGTKSAKAGVQALLTVKPGTPRDLWSDLILPMLSATLTPTEDTARGQPGQRTNEFWSNTLVGGSTIKFAPGVDAAKALRELEAGNRTALKIIGGSLQAKYNVGWLSGLPVLNDPTKVNPVGLPVAGLGWIENFNMQGGVRYTIASMISNAAEAQSPWDKLLGIGQQFFFRVLPCVESAVITPYLPVTSSRSTWRVLDKDSYVLLNGSGFMPRAWAGVGVYGQSSYTTNSPVVGNANEANAGRLAGGYMVANRGKMAFYPLPAYMMSVAAGLGVKADATQPNTNAMKEASERRRTSGNNYAQMLWTEQAFAGRSIRLQSPLRFDIAPGSTVVLKGLDINASNQVAQDHSKQLYGLVSGVRVVLDAIGPSAVCEMTITHLRTPKENDMGPEQHPLYSSTSSSVNYLSGNPLALVGDDDLKPERP
jgi:hypothetical protein